MVGFVPAALDGSGHHYSREGGVLTLFFVGQVTSSSPKYSGAPCSCLTPFARPKNCWRREAEITLIDRV